jgi:hypothetical protein
MGRIASISNADFPFPNFMLENSEIRDFEYDHVYSNNMFIIQM